MGWTISGWWVHVSVMGERVGMTCWQDTSVGSRFPSVWRVIFVGGEI